MNFVPLHVYSGYSYHKSGLKINPYVLTAKKYGYNSVGISDYSVLSGAPILVHQAKENGLKPIIGEDFIIDGLLTSFFVLNEVGYSNLLFLSNKYQINSLHYQDVRDHSEGLAVVLTIQNDSLKKSFLEDKTIFAGKLSKLCRGIETFYLGIDGINEPVYLDEMREFAFSHGYKTIAFPMIRYINKEDAIITKMVECFDNKNVLTYKSLEGDEYLKDINTLKKNYTDEEIEATNELANLVNFEFIKPRGKLLKFETPNGESSKEYLRELCMQGLKEKNQINEKYLSRLNYELDIISKMGYEDYFLIVSDYVNHARDVGIPVGPGRGSASGSLVSYALKITVPDPIKYGLLFERFLNVNRQTMPDIDVDFSDIDRGKVVEYIASKYGRDKVANILAVQKIGAKQSLRDVGRIFNYEKHEIELFTKLISDEKDDKLTLREIYKKNKEFRDLVNNDKYYLEIVTLSSKIEGLPRQTSLHAVGIVLNADNLATSIPLSIDASGALVEQFEKDYIEEQGFLKMDILALRNLTMVDDCLRRLEMRGISLKADDIPYDDKDAIKVIAEGKTMGIFQLESSGMRNAIKDLKPNSFEDIVALLALYRPGPMENIPLYGKRKAGKAKATYLSPVLKQILEPTYGIIVYQEQIMQIASRMAGFSLGDADSFRRAISKKDSKKLIKLQDSFISGSIKNGYSEKEAKNVFALIYKFADYGFNRSHSLVYAIFSLRMAYLKAHYPEEFYASILSNVGSEKSNSVFAEMRAIGISLKNPDVNKSELYFKQDNKAIVFPLHYVAGISLKTAQGIIEEREKNGSYKDLYDFVVRTTVLKLNANQIHNLIDAGAFDSLEPSRASLRNNIVNALTYAQFVVGEDGNMVIDTNLFAKPTFNRVEDDYLDNLSKELQVLGMMISGSPLKAFENKINEIGATKIGSISSSKDDAKLVVMIRRFNKTKTKKGETMGFISIYDETGELEGIPVFSSVLQTIDGKILKKNNIVIVEGNYRHYNDEFSIKGIYKFEGK